VAQDNGNLNSYIFSPRNPYSFGFGACHGKYGVIDRVDTFSFGKPLVPQVVERVYQDSPLIVGE
jgi:hypothetical protein